MKNYIIKGLLSLSFSVLVSLSLLITPTKADLVVDDYTEDREASVQEETEEDLLQGTCMAHNIYSKPSLSNTSGRFDTFLVDFIVEDDAEATLWMLCSWQMGLDSWASAHGYSNPEGGRANAGIRNQISDRVALV